MPFNVELVHGTRTWDVKVAETCSFGQLKAAASDLIGVPVEGINMIFRGRPRVDGDLLLDAGVRPGHKITAAETAEWRRTRGEDESMARAQAQAAEAEEAEAAEKERSRQQRQQQQPPPSSHPIPPPSPPSSSRPAEQQEHPAVKALDAVESTLAALEAEAEAAGLLSDSNGGKRGGGGAAEQKPPPPPAAAKSSGGGGVASFLFSRLSGGGQQSAPPPPSNSNASSSSLKEAIRIGELATQNLLKLDAVDLPHVEEGDGDDGDGEGGEKQQDPEARRRREQALALRPRRKLLVKRAQALGDAMDRAKERLS